MEDIPSREGDACRIAVAKDPVVGLDLKRLDRLDRLSLLVVILLAMTMVVVVHLAPPVKKNAVVRRRVVVLNPGLDRKLSLVERILASDNPRAAHKLLLGLKKNFSYDGRVFMLLGDYHLRVQNPVAAMHNYRQAVDLNPDFLDKNTELFQGRKIKGVLAEVANIIAVRADPAVRKELLYMRRKVAGGCG